MNNNKILNFLKKNDTNILAGVGIVDGMILGSYLWFKTGQKIKKGEIKKKWKVLLLPILNTILSTGVIVYSIKVGNKRLAALGAAYNLTEVAFQQYIDKTKEKLGEKKADEIGTEVSKDNAKKATKGDVMVLSQDGDTVFYEPLTGRYFKSTWTKIQKAANNLNAAALGSFDGKVSLTEWLIELGLPKTDISDEIGWDVTNGRNGIIDISLDAVLDDKDVPCGSIRYNTRPKHFE